MAKNQLKSKKLMAVFAAVSFIVGFFFVDRGSITGNVILNNDFSFSVFSIIGLLLILCSAILTFKIVRK